MSGLAVRIFDGKTDQHVSRFVSRLRFRKTAPGGHADASFRLDVPAESFPLLGPADRVWIYDGRTGATVWEGYTNNPGTRTGRDGQGFDITALGGAARATDERRALCYIDTAGERWTRNGLRSMQSTNTQWTQKPDSQIPGLLLGFTPGQVAATGDVAEMSYNVLESYGMYLGSFVVTVAGGKTDAGWAVEFYWIDVVSGLGAIAAGSLNATPFLAGLEAGDGQLPTSVDRFAIHLIRTGGATNIPVGTDDTWAHISSIRMQGMRCDRYGASRLAGMPMHNHNYVLPHWIVEDVVGRLLQFCDPTTAVIDAGTYQIDQLVYPDGTDAATILDDLTVYEPDMLWEILETSPTGLHRFNWRAWPTTPRYQIPSSLPFERSGGDVDLCNRIAVTWTDESGDRQITYRTSIVPELGSRIRDAAGVTLPEGRGSLANAQRLGDQILASNATAPKSGRVVVDRPILDLLTGSMVQPWEIQPGYLARVVATGDDLRLTEMEYDDDSCSATLQLGEPILTTEQRIAKLGKSA